MQGFFFSNNPTIIRMSAYLTETEVMQMKKHLSTVLLKARGLTPSDRKRVYNAARLSTLTLEKAVRRATRLERKAGTA